MRVRVQRGASGTFLLAANRASFVSLVCVAIHPSHPRVLPYSAGHTLQMLIRLSSATVFNLSLLTADVYSLIYAVCFFGQHFEWLYVISFVSTLLGLALYTSAAPPHDHRDGAGVLKQGLS